MILIERHMRALIRSYSEIVFTSNYAVGIAVFLTTFLNPNVAVSGVIAVISANLFAWIINFDRGYLDRGHFVFNPLLTGMAIGYVFKLSPESLVLVAVAGVLSLVITIAASGLLSYYMKLPVLSLPFAVTSAVLYLAAAKYDGFKVIGFYPHWDVMLTPALPMWLAGFFKSFGMIFFLP
jgi:urea transporter